ncbi:hypothetical protein AB1L42_05090 [Thalassoglobus sp. JC818]|uniref:hypothetical protein n=1 Tax=Thalassoglobus sp. JC818 TaxID=3232136 RepID=UPI00345B31D9
MSVARTCIAGLLIALFACDKSFCAQQPVKESASESTASLVRQLGSRSFQVRSDAERKLLESGFDSLGAINQGINSDDPEVRTRSLRVMQLLERSIFVRYRDKIRDNPWLFPQQLTPGWETFFELVGESPEARALYVQLLQSETAIMLSLNRPGWQSRFEQRCGEILSFPQGPFQAKTSLATMTALLFLACHPENTPSGPATTVINSFLNDSQFRRATRDQKTGTVLRSLVGQWILCSVSSSSSQRLSLAASFEMAEGLDAARELISQRHKVSFSPTHLEDAISYLGRYGGPVVIEELEQLLDDEMKLRGRYRGGPEVQVRDIALAALLHLTNQNPESYGLHDLRPRTGFLYIGSSVRFGSTEDRLSAIEQWRTWRARNLGIAVPDTTIADEGIVL